ncbi:hypothetical protein TNCV_1379271 [Trichonephila clavipes]|nr:hypothetical protein TNCV_1379271 [Trichonephila clavipes]
MGCILATELITDTATNDKVLGEKRGLYKDLERAILQAEKAQKMNMKDRLLKYSFGCSYRGNLGIASFYVNSPLKQNRECYAAAKTVALGNRTKGVQPNSK